MNLPGNLGLIHQPVRLQIMGLLYRARDAAFTEVRDRLDLTDGNLANHAGRLEEAGLLESRRALTSDGFEKRFRITTQGTRAFRRYVAEIEGFLDSVEGAREAKQPASEGDT